MPHPAVTAIKALGVDAVEVAHTLGEVGLRGFHQEMIVVTHQTVGMHPPVKSLSRAGQHVQAALSVSVVRIDRLLAVAPRGDVVERAAEFESQGSGHGRSVANAMGKAKGKT